MYSSWVDLEETTCLSYICLHTRYMSKEGIRNSVSSSLSPCCSLRAASCWDAHHRSSLSFSPSLSLRLSLPLRTASSFISLSFHTERVEANQKSGGQLLPLDIGKAMHCSGKKKGCILYTCTAILQSIDPLWCIGRWLLLSKRKKKFLCFSPSSVGYDFFRTDAELCRSSYSLYV